MKPTVLVADDDAELGGIYRQFLRNRGYEVETASDGLDCLEKLRRLNPEVLVLDRELRWGGADGILAWLREESFNSDVAVVETATVTHSPLATEPPVVKIMAKPFTLTTLLESIRTALAEKNSQKPLVPRNQPVPAPEYFLG